MSIFVAVSWSVVTVSTVSKYIALEGVDGSGKTTVGRGVVERLVASGEKAVFVREPGGTAVGEVVRGIVLDSESLDDWAEVFLFAAQRAELARQVIAPALETATWVVSDRSYYSSLAYQGGARGLGVDRVRAINETGLDGVIPDYIFVLDVDPELALSRQDTPDRIGREGLEFQSAVRECYLELSQAEEKVVVIEGGLTIDETVARIMDVVR